MLNENLSKTMDLHEDYPILKPTIGAIDFAVDCSLSTNKHCVLFMHRLGFNTKMFNLILNLL